MSKSTYGRRRAGLAALATTALIAGACAAGAGAASADTGFHFGRIGGTDRYDTAALVADEYGNKTTAILANGQPGNYADALAANYLSGVKDAPVLLTKTNDTPKYTKDQLAQMNVSKIFVIGGEDKVSAAQVSALESDGYSVTRIAGSDRFQTDKKVVAEGGQAKSSLAVVATGFDFPDALAGGPLAWKGSPLALTSRDDINNELVQQLLDSGVNHAIVLGGADKVGQAVIDELNNKGIHVDERLAGADRAETSVKVAKYAKDHLNFSNSAVNVASGYVHGYGADALSGGPLTGQENRPMLITKDVNIPGPSVLKFLKDNANTLTTGTIFGDPNAVSTSAQKQMEDAAQSVTTNQSYSVTPNSAQTAEQGKSVQYSVSGLDNNTTYTVQLFNCDNVTTDANGQTTFTQTVAPSKDNNNTGSGAAAPGATGKNTISVLNGQAARGEHDLHHHEAVERLDHVHRRQR